MLQSGPVQGYDVMITGANEIAEKPAVVDVPHGQGHVLLFAENPMWRSETSGSYFLIFNSILNYDHLNAGAANQASAPASSANSGGAGHDPE